MTFPLCTLSALVFVTFPRHTPAELLVKGSDRDFLQLRIARCEARCFLEHIDLVALRFSEGVSKKKLQPAEDSPLVIVGP